jgi:hypothetical protein
VTSWPPLDFNAFTITQNPPSPLENTGHALWNLLIRKNLERSKSQHGQSMCVMLSLPYSGSTPSCGTVDRPELPVRVS